MTKDEFKRIMAAKAGTLITPKHDLQNLPTTYPKHRSVLSADLPDNLQQFLLSENYVATGYEKKRHPSSPIYIEIQPSPASAFNIPAWGVDPYSAVPSTALDRLVAVSGVQQDWYLYGEDTGTIQTKVANGEFKKNGRVF